MNEPIAVPAPSVAPRRVMLLVKSVQIAHQAGMYLMGGRWHKIHPDKPAPAGVPVVAEKPASGHTRMTSDMWAQVYAHADNSNKATFTKKLDKLKEAYEAGDEKAILAGSYPNDTTNKKVVKVANYLLGLMGSEHTVHAGLKQGTHHTLTGEVPPAKPVEAPAPVVHTFTNKNAPDLEAHIKQTSDGKWSANIYDKEQATYMPNIGVYGTEAEAVGVFGDAWIKPGAVDDGKPSKPATGSAHWNEVNDLIEAAMHTGNLADLQVKVDTTTGLQSPSAVMTHEYAKSSFDYVAKKAKDSMGAAILSAGSASEAQQMGFDYLAQVGTTPETVGHVVEALEVSGYDKAAAGFQNAKDTAAAIKAANGPKEGDTKEGADGMLVLKDGHWVKQDQGQPQPEATTAPADVHPIDAVPMPDLSNLFQPLKTQASLDLLKQQIKDHGVSALKGITKKMKSSGKVITYLTAATTGKPYKIASYEGNGQSHDAIYHYVEALKEAAGKSPAKAKAKPAAPAAAPKAAEPAHPSMDDWKQIGPQGGSNPGGKFIDPNGVEWYCKFPGDENMAKSEVLAAKLYAAAGISAQDAKLVTKDGKIGIASKWEDVSKGSPAALAKAKGAKAGFAVDAWLANHDVVGLDFDNLQLDANGNAMRVDAGGSLEYRAQGAKKEFGDTVTEIDTLRDKSINDKSAAVFGKMTKADITASVANVLKVSSAQIYALVNTYGPGTADDKAKLAATLIARKADLLAKYPKAKKEKKIVFKPESISAPPSFTNWGGTGGSGPSSKEFINLANEKAVQSIYTAAQTGKPETVKGLATETYNKATGEVTGTAPVLEHPSQHVKGYAQQAMNEIHQQLNPPKVFRFDGGHPLHSLNAAYPAVNGATHGDTVAKAGKFLVLGTPGTIELAALGLDPASWANGKLDQATYSPVALAAISAMPVTQKQAIQSYTGSGYHEINSSLWSGNPSGASKSAAEALSTLGHEIKPGTILSRKLSLSGTGLNQILASTGKILQEPAIMSTSIRPSSWSGNTQLKLHVGPGVKGLWVGKGSTGSGGGLSHHQGEDELILPPNTRLLIMSVKHVSGPDADGFGNGINHVIEAVILPSEQPAK